MSPAPFRLAWESSESRGCGPSQTCLKRAPGDSPPCVTRPGPAPCTPSSVPLPWAVGVPWRWGGGAWVMGGPQGPPSALPWKALRGSPVGLPALCRVWPCLRTGARKLPAQPLQKPHGGLTGFLLWNLACSVALKVRVTLSSLTLTLRHTCPRAAGHCVAVALRASGRFPVPAELQPLVMVVFHL